MYLLFFREIKIKNKIQSLKTRTVVLFVLLVVQSRMETRLEILWLESRWNKLWKLLGLGGASKMEKLCMCEGIGEDKQEGHSEVVI
jgi:hypothetical protein